jgi:tetratricopeptide (TPR) repeat protein
MPKSRAYDGGHTVFTNHSIPRKQGKQSEVGKQLSAYYDRPLPGGLPQRNLGMAYASVGAIEEAWPLLRAAVQRKPRDAPLYAQTGLLLEASGRIEQAIDFYRLSVEIDANQDAALARLGMLLAQRGEDAEARRLLQKALLRNPRQPELRKRLAALQ